MWRMAAHSDNPIENGPHYHAMVMAGRETLFLCHMPMLDCEIHMYQLVLRATLPDEDLRRYRQRYDEADPRDRFFLVNKRDDPMTILELATGERPSFRAEVWDRARVIPGQKIPPWDEQSKPFIDETEVTVDRVVYFRHFDLNLNRPRSLTYVIFGWGNEAHLYHYQTQAPDYDHVVSLAAVPEWLPPGQLQAGIHVNFPELPEGLPIETCSNPLPSGSTHVVRYCGIEAYDCRLPHGDHPAPTQPQPLPPFEVTIGRQLWANTSIGNPVGADPCPQGFPRPSDGH